MLTKKQYVVTLGIAVLLFFICFIVTYRYYSHQGSLGQQANTLQKVDIAQVQEEEITIAPHTKITLKVQDTTTNKEHKTNIDAKSLLGLTEEEVAERFEDYTVEAFSEKEVLLKKEIASQALTAQTATYVLGVLGDYVCIKEKDSTKRPIQIDYPVRQLSGYMYSMLLNEEIVITNKQKEALLVSPTGLQRILQDYVGE